MKPTSGVLIRCSPRCARRLSSSWSRTIARRWRWVRFFTVLPCRSRVSRNWFRSSGKKRPRQPRRKRPATPHKSSGWELSTRLPLAFFRSPCNRLRPCGNFLDVDIRTCCARIPASSEEKHSVSSPQMSAIISQTDFPGLKLRGRGKVRDIYELDDRLLIVATDRLSAFDVVLPTPIPDKGCVLTQLSLFWFIK